MVSERYTISIETKAAAAEDIDRTIEIDFARNKTKQNSVLCIVAIIPVRVF